MRKLFAVVAAVVLAADGFAAGPEIVCAYAINGRLAFRTVNNDFRILQEYRDGDWSTVNNVFASAGYYCGPDQSLRGECTFRICGQYSDDWTEFTVDAGEPATGTLIYNGDASSYYASYPIGNAFDGIPGSYYHASQGFASGEDQALYLDMGEPKYVGQVAAMRRLDYGNRIGNAVFEGANTLGFSDAVTLHELASDATSGDGLYSCVLENPRKVRYVRLRPRGTGMADGWFNVAEVEIRVVSAPADEIAMTLGEVSLSEGLVDSVELSLANFDADTHKVVRASGPFTVDSANAGDWPVADDLDIAGGTTSFTVPLPAGWGQSVKSMRFFLVDESDGSTLSFTDPVSCYGGAVPSLGQVAVSGFQVGNDVVFTGAIASLGGGDVTVTVETSVLGDFSDIEEWPAVCDEENLSYICHLANSDEEHPAELPANTVIGYRVRIVDGDGRETLSTAGSFTTGANFCAAPALSYGCYAICGSIYIPLAGIMNMSEVVIDMKDGYGQWRRVTGSFGSTGQVLYSLSNEWQGRSDFRIAYGGDSEPTLWTGFSVNARFRVVGEPYYLGKEEGYYISNGGTIDHIADCDPGTIYHAAYDIGDTSNDPSVYMDFGEETVIAQAAIYYSSGYGASRIGHVVFEAADDRNFTENVRALYTLSDDDLFTGAPMAVCSFEPTAVRYVRARPQAGAPFDGWFNVGELEFGLDPSRAYLSVSVADGSLPDCWPTLSFSRDFNPGGRVAVFRASREDGTYRKIAELAAGIVEWTDTTLQIAQRVWYRVAKIDANGTVETPDADGVAFTRGHLIPLASVPKFMLNAPSDFASVVDYVFTGSDTPNGYLTVAQGRQSGGFDMFDPMIGVDFRSTGPVHVTMCRFYPQTGGYHSRMNGVQVFGSNNAEEYQKAIDFTPHGDGDGRDFIEASTAISKEFNVPQAKWYNYICDDSSAYDFVYLGYFEDRGLDVGWVGDVDEIKFYGYTEDEIPSADGVVIIMR